MTASNGNFVGDLSSKKKQANPTTINSMNSSKNCLYSYLRLIFLTSVACGLEFCVCAGFVYIPSLLMEHDIEGYEMSFILSLAPLIAIITTPFIGKMSDDCHSKSGGRKPIIVTLSLGVFFSLCLLGSYEDISSILIPPQTGQTVATLANNLVSHDRLSKILLITGIFGLDYCTQVCLNPFESLLSDIYKNTKWAELSYAIYSSMLALGSCVGYLIVALDWNVTYLTKYLNNNNNSNTSQETTIFYFLAILFVLSLMATMISLAESKGNVFLKGGGSGTTKNETSNGRRMAEWRSKFSPDCAAIEKNEHSSTDVNFVDKVISVEEEKYKLSGNEDDGYESNNNSELSDSELLYMVFEERPSPLYSKRNSSPRGGLNNSDNRHYMQLRQSPDYNKTNNHDSTAVDSNSFVYRFVASLYASRFLHWPTKRLLRLFLKCRNSARFIGVWIQWPTVLKKLFWVHLFMWTSLMIHNLFYADYMGRFVYGGDPRKEVGNPMRTLYDTGVRSASWGLLYHSLLGAIASPLIERFLISPQLMSIKMLYTLSLYLFDFVMFALILVPPGSVRTCNLVTSLTGITLAVVNSVPFILLSKYHGNKPKFYFDQYRSSKFHSPPPSLLSSSAAASCNAAVKILPKLIKSSPSSSKICMNEKYTTVDDIMIAKAKLHHQAKNKSQSHSPTIQNYHNNYSVSYSCSRKNFGIGSDIAVLDIGYFLAQIIASLIIGQIIKITPDPRYYMFSALALSSFGCYFAKHVIASEAELQDYHSKH